MNVKYPTLAALLLAACSFGTTRYIVPNGATGHASSAVVNGDHTDLFVGELNGDLVVTNPNSGVETGRRALPPEWAIEHLVVNQADDDTAWALHANGYVIEWNSSLNLVGLVSPRPTGSASSRTYCDFDVHTNGHVYTTSIDTIAGTQVSVLSHYDGSTWNTLQLPGSDCVPMSFDEYRTEVVTLNGFALQHYDADLNPIDSVQLDEDAWCADVHDIDVLYGHVLAGGMCWETDPKSKLWLFDDNGTLNTATVSNTEWVNSVQILVYPQGTYEALTAGFDEQHVVSATQMY